MSVARARGSSRGVIALSPQGSFSDVVERLNKVSSSANECVRSLADAVDACNAEPSSARVESVKAAAKAARVELVRLRDMRDELRPGEKGYEIASTHFGNAAKSYSRELLRLKTPVLDHSAVSPPSSPSAPAMAGQNRPGVPVQGHIWADPTLIYQAKEVATRTKELERLQASFQGITTLVEELNVLVVNQGELLDSADQHVEDTNLYLEGGYKKLSSAKRLKNMIRRKKALVGTACVVILVVGIVVLVVLL